MQAEADPSIQPSSRAAIPTADEKRPDLCQTVLASLPRGRMPALPPIDCLSRLDASHLGSFDARSRLPHGCSPSLKTAGSAPDCPCKKLFLRRSRTINGWIAPQCEAVHSPASPVRDA